MMLVFLLYVQFVCDERTRHGIFCAFDLSARQQKQQMEGFCKSKGKGNKESAVDFRDFCRCLAMWVTREILLL